MASGDQANTSQKRKKPSGKKAKRLSQKKQSERFVDTARELDSDESGREFERAIKTVIPRRDES